jgi:hypothetical protein
MSDFGVLGLHAEAKRRHVLDDELARGAISEGFMELRMEYRLLNIDPVLS